MDKFQAWINDKKNLPFVIAGVVGLVAVVGAVIYFTMFAGGGETDMAAVPSLAPGMEPMPPAPGMPPVATPGAPAPGTTAAPPPTGPPPKKEPPLEEYRTNPFDWYVGPKPRKPKLQFTRNLPKPDIRRVSPVRIADADEPQETLPPQPVRRMAGILKNDRIFAIIDTEGTATVVKPGDPVGADLQVERILPDRVILRSTRTRRPIYVEVPRSAGNITSQPVAPRDTPGPRGGGPRMTPPPPRGGRGGLEEGPPP